MVWLRRTTHYLFIVVVAVNSTLLTINAGDYIFYTDWMWTSFVVFSISQSTMLAVGAIYYMLFTGVPGTNILGYEKEQTRCYNHRRNADWPVIAAV
jgi:methane/ammonia monooxygenase subunit A